MFVTLAESTPLDSSLFSLGVGGVIVVMLFKEMLKYLARRSEAKDKQAIQETAGSSQQEIRDALSILRKIEKRVDDLHRMHDIKDRDGVPVWYNKSATEEHIRKLGDGVEKLTKAVDALATVVDDDEEGDQ